MKNLLQRLQGVLWDHNWFIGKSTWGVYASLEFRIVLGAYLRISKGDFRACIYTPIGELELHN